MFNAISDLNVLIVFSYFSEDSPLFDYKTMRAQNERLYNLLPEANYKINAKKKAGIKKTNRLMSTMYSQVSGDFCTQ